MTAHNAFIALLAFGYKEGEVGLNSEDRQSMWALLDIMAECDDVIPDRQTTYKLFRDFYIENYYDSL